MDTKSSDKREENALLTSEENTSEIPPNIGEVVEAAEVQKPCGCGAMPDNIRSESKSYIYAIGKVAPRHPNQGIEKEIAQAVGLLPKEQTKGFSQPEVLRNFLTDPEGRYIARQICWVFSIHNVESYILVLRDPSDISRLSQTLRASTSGDDIDVVVGTLGPLSSPQMCNGLILPIVVVDQIYYFNKDDFFRNIPKTGVSNQTKFKNTVNAVFTEISQITDNGGATDEHRALNFLALRNEDIYYVTQKMQDDNYYLSGVEARASSLSNIARKIIDVIFSYENRNTAVTEKWRFRVDVTDEFPFVLPPHQRYLDR